VTLSILSDDAIDSEVTALNASFNFLADQVPVAA
jgi:hypothetical protein